MGRPTESLGALLFVRGHFAADLTSPFFCFRVRRVGFGDGLAEIADREGRFDLSVLAAVEESRAYS